MNISEIDWNTEWNRAREERPRKRDSSFWDRRAPSFCKHATESDYEKQFLALLQPQPSWSILDVGCGSGTLAIPLASRVASVTALDFSTGMLEQLQQRCLDGGITNITAIHGRWEDDWDKFGIETCDVAIASRSMAVDNLGEALTKLDRTARKQVFISAMVGDGPNDRRIFNAVGRPLKRGPDYIYTYNLLYQMGIYANISHISGSDWQCYESIDDAVEGMRWMLDEITSEEERRLREYLLTELVPHERGWRLPAPKIVRWAVINWKKEV